MNIADKEGVKRPEVGSTTLTANNKEEAKVLATNGTNKPGSAVGDKAAAILSTVSGNEMLASIVDSKEGYVELSSVATANTTPLEFAKGANNGNHLNQEAAKAAAVAGGIALRSLVKTSTLAANNSGDDKTVQAAGVDAVNKLLGAEQ